MSEAIFLLQDNGQIIDMREQAFESEEFMQKLIAQHPQLLMSEQSLGTISPRLLLISREMGLPSEENGGDRWAIDHLLIDQDAILTVVEVKRSNDTRIRREVVGQMLDYAANAVAFLPIEKIRTSFERTHPNPQDAVASMLGDDELTDYESFWEKVRTNLQAGKMRLMFVADEIPSELRQIVEFLNKNMPSIDVLAVEIKQYTDTNTGFKTLVPRVLGQTAEAQRMKTSYSRRTVDTTDLRQSVQVRLSDAVYRIDQYQGYAVKVYNIDKQVEEKAMPLLKRINDELELGIDEYNVGGNAINTRQWGDKVIKQLQQQGKVL